jgi:hypothetical protein
MAVDYEALALEMGGTIVPDVDYEALALEMGGTLMPVDEVVAPQEFPGSAQFGGMESAVEIPGLDPKHWARRSVHRAASATSRAYTAGHAEGH